jgi:hypothetical protein
MTRSSDPRAHELLADRALHGLDDADAHQLDALGATDDDSYDLAAAAIDLATLPIEPMPAALADRVADRLGAARHPRTVVGWEMRSQSPSSSPSAPPPSIAGPSQPSLSVVPQPSPSRPSTPLPVAPPVEPRARRRPLVSVFAAAATLALVAGAWWLLRGRVAPTGPTDPVAIPAAQARAELLASTTDAARLDWRPAPEAAAASGDVVWSPSAQRGYMRFVGLPANDPAKTQYQLWIFDRQRDQAFPVDGGVFDVTSTGEVVVPINPKLHVDDATLFAVTIERPGGVVVSKREHIVVTAARS